MCVVQLLVLIEQCVVLEYFEKVVEQVDSWIVLIDLVVGDVGVIMCWMFELLLLVVFDMLLFLSIQGFQVEVIILCESLMEIVNWIDVLGQFLFFGYLVGFVFEDIGDGFVYCGDLGQFSQ